MTPSVTVPANLPDIVRAAFVRARAAGDLTFFPTQVALLHVHGIPFQLRFAPSLANKPKGAKPNPAGSGEQPRSPHYDPFDDPPPGLVVVPQLGGGGGGGGLHGVKSHHRLVLNKFAVCQDHAILATTAFRPQHHLLDAGDLAAAYACIEAYASASSSSAGGEELFVFYNSGRHSGASQPHRHLQLLPVARMREGLEKGDDDATGWSVLADRLQAGGDDLANAPFYVAVAQLRDGDDSGNGDGRFSLPPPPSPETLHATYLGLYRQACNAAKGTAAFLTTTSDEEETKTTQRHDYNISDDEGKGIVPARISYNLALTRRTMALLPRTAEGASLNNNADGDGGGGGDSSGTLSLNGTVLAGTALVKSEAEWDALRSDPALLERVLGQIGVPVRRESLSPSSSSSL